MLRGVATEGQRFLQSNLFCWSVRSDNAPTDLITDFTQTGGVQIKRLWNSWNYFLDCSFCHAHTWEPQFWSGDLLGQPWHGRPTPTLQVPRRLIGYCSNQSAPQFHSRSCWLYDLEWKPSGSVFTSGLRFLHVFVLHFCITIVDDIFTRCEIHMRWDPTDFFRTEELWSFF